MKWKKPTCTFLVAIIVLSTAMLSVGADTQTPKLFVDPQTYTATQLGEVFTININITNVHNLAGFGFKLSYNTTLLDALNAVEGPLPKPPVSSVININEPEGYIWIMVLCSPTNGNGTLATITFKVTYAGSASCILDLSNTVLVDINENPILHNVEDGTYKFAILEVTVTTDKPCYSLGEKVQIHGNLTLDGAPLQGLVALQVVDESTYARVIRTLQTGPTPPGNVTIIEVIPCGDIWGTPRESFQAGTTAYFKVTVTNNDIVSRNVTVTINVYDGDMAPLGTGASRASIAPGATYSTTRSMEIPEWASIGNATVCANAFTDWPGPGPSEDRPRNGIPYCPEISATFQITGTAQGATTSETGSENPGNYNLTFKLPPDARTGLYRVYAISSYKGQPTDSTVFGVNTICVPDHYLTIQGAVDAASPTNNTIIVGPETYNEHVTINKTLTLVGTDPSSTIINGNGTGTVITVSADNVEISGFTIQNGGSSPDSGIALKNSSGSTISENIITSNNGYGIYLNHSTSNTLRDNIMIGNKYNFGVFGDLISDFTHDIATSNTVDGKPIIYWVNKHDDQIPPNAGFVAVVGSTKIAARGLDLTKNGQGVLFAFTNDSLIERVNTTSNEYGIYLYDSYGNTIVGSTVSNDTVGTYQRYCNENIICHNNFINNTQQVYNYSSANTWNDSAGKGNYWSDYTGADDGSGNRTAEDGVGDTLLPHQGIDWYPLMNPWTLVHDVAITSVTPVIPYNASYLYPGWVIHITVTVKNEADFTETFNIAAYYDGNPIETKTLTELTPQKETAINLTWDTTGVSPGTVGLNYTIKAVASIIPGETETKDNTLIDGMVQVNLLGDVNNDGKVSVMDMLLLHIAITVGKTAAEEPFCDVNGDGEISVMDLLELYIIVVEGP